jgi:DNA-binding transcriptional ArsR family regulator
VRWVLAGSAGLDAFTQRLQLGATVGDLLLFPLDALPEGRALELLASLARTRGLAIPEATAGHLIDRIGWPIPYYVQLVVHQLAELYPRRGGTRTPIQVDNAAVDEAFAALSRPTSRLYFDPWYQRLTEELGRPHDVWARALLTASALDPDGAARPTLQGVLGRLVQDAGEREEALSWLLAVLEGDGYLVRDEGTGRYRFRSPLLREYWVRRVS